MTADDSSSGSLSGTTIGRFRVGPLLGRGGMGEVYRADDIELGRAVALKVLPEHLVGDSDRLARFVQEARTASALNHPHVVSIYDIGQGTASNGRPVHFIAMELVSGETLRSLFDRHDVDRRRLLDYAAQAADALGAAHAAGIVHRDLKPENVMVADGGYVKVLDFGLAKLKAEPALTDSAAQALTQTMKAATTPGMVMGTVGYMSPEQALGRAVDHRSDIFSFGCILYEGGGRHARVRRHVGHRHAPPDHPHRSRAALATRAGHARRAAARRPQVPAEGSGGSLSVDEGCRGRSAIAAAAARLGIGGGAGATARLTMAPRAFAALAAAALAARSVAGAWLARRAAAPGETATAVTLQRVTETGIVVDAVISPDGKYIAYVESAAGKQGDVPASAERNPPDRTGRAGLGGILGHRLRARRAVDLLRREIAVVSNRRPVPDSDARRHAAPAALGHRQQRHVLARSIADRVLPRRSRSTATARSSSRTPTDRTRACSRPGIRPTFSRPAFSSRLPGRPTASGSPPASGTAATRDAHLVTIDLSSGSETVFPDRFAVASATAWAPDGSGILFVAVPLRGWTTGNGGQIHFQPFPSGPLRHVTNDVVEYRNISVSEDGRSLVSVGFDTAVRLYEVPYAGGEERRIDGTRYDGASGVAWMPDGRRFVFGRPVQGQRTLWSAAADGSDPRQLTSEGTAVWPAVSADGRSLVFFGDRGADNGIWRSDADGSNPRLLAKVADASSIVFAPDQKSVYFTSSTGGAPATYRSERRRRHSRHVVAPLLERAGVSHDGRLLAGIYRENARAPLTLGVVDVQTGKPVDRLRRLHAGERQRGDRLGA